MLPFTHINAQVFRKYIDRASATINHAKFEGIFVHSHSIFKYICQPLYVLAYILNICYQIRVMAIPFVIIKMSQIVQLYKTI